LNNPTLAENTDGRPAKPITRYSAMKRAGARLC